MSLGKKQFLHNSKKESKKQIEKCEGCIKRLAILATIISTKKNLKRLNKKRIWSNIF